MSELTKLTVSPHLRLRPDHIDVWDEVVLAKDYFALSERLENCVAALGVRTAERDECKVALRSLESAPSATRTTEPTEAMVEAAANIIAATSLIDSPKLLTPCWMSLARSIVKAALSAAPQPGAQEAGEIVERWWIRRDEDRRYRVCSASGELILAGDYVDENEVVERAAEIAERLTVYAAPMSARPEELRSEWISVGDRLPKTRIRCTTAARDGFIYDGYVDWDGIWKYTDQTMKVREDSITHWQPLPSPPMNNGGQS